MSRIKKAFSNGKAFIPFITCGDPDLETTAKIVRQMVDKGADLIELGIPFSDPTAEGPVIQEASLRALSAGVTSHKIFDMVRDLRRDIDVPLVFMTYANVVFAYGVDRFIKTSVEIGMDALILPDIPFEEKDEIAPICSKYGLDFISLIAPTSKNRIEMIAKEAEGFIYCISSIGVTGVRSEIALDVKNMVELVRKVNPEIPCAVGFGISTCEHARELAQHTDGIIVGSAIMQIIGQYGKEAAPHVSEYVYEMKRAMNGY